MFRNYIYLLFCIYSLLFVSCQPSIDIDTISSSINDSYSLKYDNGAYMFSDSSYANSCEEYLNSSAYSNEGNGIYWLAPGADPFKVYCDMTTAGGGWTVIISNGDNSDDETTGACILRLGTDASYICGVPGISTDYVADVRDLVFDEMVFVTLDNSDQIAAQAYMKWNTQQGFPTTTSTFYFSPDIVGQDLGSGVPQIGCRTNLVQTIGNHTISANRGGYSSGTIVFMLGTDGPNLWSDSNVLGFTDTKTGESFTGFDDIQDGKGCEDNIVPLNQKGARAILMIR